MGQNLKGLKIEGEKHDIGLNQHENFDYKRCGCDKELYQSFQHTNNIAPNKTKPSQKSIGSRHEQRHKHKYIAMWSSTTQRRKRSMQYIKCSQHSCILWIRLCKGIGFLCSVFGENKVKQKQKTMNTCNIFAFILRFNMYASVCFNSLWRKRSG